MKKLITWTLISVIAVWFTLFFIGKIEQDKIKRAEAKRVAALKADFNTGLLKKEYIGRDWPLTLDSINIRCEKETNDAVSDVNDEVIKLNILSEGLDKYRIEGRSLLPIYNAGLDFCGPSFESIRLKKELKAAEERKAKIESQFSVWDGAHHSLENLVEMNLRDPNSYDHISTNYFEMGDHLVVNMKYRARNGFGGMAIGFVKAKYSINGDLIEIVEQR